MKSLLIRYAHKTLSGRYTSTREAIIHYTNGMKSIFKVQEAERANGDQRLPKSCLVFPLDRLKVRAFTCKYTWEIYVNSCQLREREKGEPLNEQTLSMGIALVCLFSCHVGSLARLLSYANESPQHAFYVRFLRLPISIMPILI